MAAELTFLKLYQGRENLYRNRKEHTDPTGSSRTPYSNYPIIYYLSQMLRQPKPKDVMLSQKRKKKELRLIARDITRPHIPQHSFYNIHAMSSSMAARGPHH